MASLSRIMNLVFPTKAKESLHGAKWYRIVRYVVAGLTLATSLLALLSVWYADYKDTTTINYLANDSLSQAALAFGILGLFLGFAVLGSKKQPFSLFMVILGVAFIIILAAISGTIFADTAKILIIPAPPAS